MPSAATIALMGRQRLLAGERGPDNALAPRYLQSNAAADARLNTAASLHMAVASDNVLVMELKPLPSPMQHELVMNPIDQHDGWVAPPGGPGLGLDVDEAVVRRYLFD